MSYLIATWNRKEALERHLGLLEKQTYQGALEVLVCVDGSTDGTQEMLKAWESPRYTLKWFDTGNILTSTAAKSRNNGLRAATGDILIMADDDCLPHPRMIEKFVERFHPQEVQLGYKTCYEKYLGYDLPIPIDEGNPKTWHDAWKNGNFCYFQTGCCCMGLKMSRNKAKDGSFGFDERFEGYGHEDSEFGRRLHRHYGAILTFNPDAVAWHMNPSACSQYALVDKATGKAKTNAILQRILMEPLYKYPGNRIFGWMHTEELQWLYAQAQKMTSIVEIGSWQGRSLHALLSGCAYPVWAVDNWDEELMAPYGSAREAKEIFRINMAPFSNLTVLEMSSPEAAQRFKDGSVDMVFIDADHRYEAIKADIGAWLPKTEVLICGHDFSPNWPGVEQAVREIFGDNFGVIDHIWFKELA